jgi:peptide/nickel transport system permease protein
MSFGAYLLRRIIFIFPMLIGISIISFIIIQLPPGDFLTMYIMQLQSRGYKLAEDEIARLKDRYGLNDPIYIQYFKWIWNIVRYGDLGRSFSYDKQVKELISERITLSVIISIFTLLFSWGIGFFIGVYSATHQYSLGDYIFTFLGFIGMSLPGFLLALIFIYISLSYFKYNPMGLFSAQYLGAPWSLAKVLDMLKHIWGVIIVLGIGGTASITRIIRGCLLDELRKQYVITARAKGLPEKKLLFKYPVKIAINPLLSTIGWLLPSIFSGEALASIVLNIPTNGPLLLEALMTQDMYLAGSFVLILSTLVILGSLISDILLAWVDPRIRYG